MPKYLKISLFLLLILLCFSGGFFYANKANANKVKQVSKIVAATRSNSILLNPILPYVNEIGLDYHELKSFKPKIETYINSKKSENPDLHISFYFRDLCGGLWSGVNENEFFSPASLFKLPVMIALLKKAEKDPEALKIGVKYKAKDYENIEEESGFKKEEGKFYTTDDLLTQMICYSDNTASLILLSFLGDSSILKVISDLNMNVSSQYDNNTNFVSVKAYAGIFRVLYNASFLNKEMSEKALGLLSKSTYNKGIRSAVPAQIVVAHKYGKRDVIGDNGKINSVQLHHFGIVYHSKKPYIIGVMTRGGSIALKEKIIHDIAEIAYNEVDKQCNKNHDNQVFKE
jgi:beta-lactamase class A